MQLFLKFICWGGYMKELITREYNGVGVHFELINGESYVSVEDVAKFCGWTKIANSGNEVIRWDRVEKYLKELGVPTCGHGDFIPEYIMYPLIGKANNEKATQFMLWVGKVIAEIRQTGKFELNSSSYRNEIETVKSEIGLIDMVSNSLKLNDNSKLQLITNSFENHNINTNLLPSYTPSKGVLKSATELLKEHKSELSVIKFNKKLVELGILKECTRQSTKDKTKVKKFKNLVDTTWGENQINPKNPKETQPLYYENKFKELLEIVQA